MVNFRLISTLATLNNSFELTIAFRVVNSTQFGLQLKAKYPITIDTYDDGSVRVFIYNKLDFQNLYIRLDYQVITFASLLAGAGSQIIKTYTTLFNPNSTNNILFGFNGMELNGYAKFGFKFAIDPVSVGTSYTVTLTNMFTTSAIPRLDLMLVLPSEFRCPNNETLIDTTLLICYTACLTGFY